MTTLYILAGGQGTRFFPFTALIPKCLIPVAGKPCIRWIIEDAINQNCFSSIVVCVNKKDFLAFQHELRDLLSSPNDESARDLYFTISVTDEPSGTVGELVNALQLGDTFVLRYGDDLTEIDYKALLVLHKEKKAAVTLAVTSRYQLPVGIVKITKKGEVADFIEKPYYGYAWMGIAVFDKRVFSYFGGKDFAKDVFPKMLRHGEPLFGYVTESKWYDVGNIENWRKVDEYFRSFG